MHARALGAVQLFAIGNNAPENVGRRVDFIVLADGVVVMIIEYHLCEDLVLLWGPTPSFGTLPLRFEALCAGS